MKAKSRRLTGISKGWRRIRECRRDTKEEEEGLTIEKMIGNERCEKKERGYS